jgi:hypothetical protein
MIRAIVFAGILSLLLNGKAHSKADDPFSAPAAPVLGAPAVPRDTAGSTSSQPDSLKVLAWLDRIKLSGTLDGQMRYLRHKDLAVKDSRATTDLYFRLLELGIETSFSDWATAIAVLNSEWIGDYMNAGDERMTVDEIHFDIKEDDVPLYFVFGKRTLAFGEFENDLVSDPMTQDAYETKKVGATIGYSGPLEFDASVTVYKGDEAMSHLFQSGLFDAARIARNPLAVDNSNSCIVSAFVAPFHDTLTIFGAVSNEPGAGRRNSTVDAGISFKIPFYPSITVNGEYMKALQREDYVGANRQYRESVLAASISYSFVRKKSGIASRGLYKARKAYRKSHPIMVAVRFERFDDDSMAKEFGGWSVKNRYLAGGRYTMFRSGDVSAYLGIEYRRTEFRLSPAVSDALNNCNDEVYINWGLDF